MDIEPSLPANPFASMKIADFDFLHQSQREVCPKCNSSRKQICYECLKPMGDISRVPQVTLPIQLDILHWPSEARSKSTATHACILAPDNTRFLDHPEIPQYNESETVLLYPSDDAPTVAAFPNLSKIKTVIFVDSQWHAANKILRHEALSKVPHIKITQYRTLFWRYQHCGDHCLATIEAIYYFFKEHHVRMHGTYNGEYDNLLFYFAYNYQLIQKKYQTEKIVFPRIDNYVQIEGMDCSQPKDKKYENQRRKKKAEARAAQNVSQKKQKLEKGNVSPTKGKDAQVDDKTLAQ